MTGGQDLSDPGVFVVWGPGWGGPAASLRRQPWGSYTKEKRGCRIEVTAHGQIHTHVGPALAPRTAAQVRGPSLPPGNMLLSPADVEVHSEPVGGEERGGHSDKSK